jgi:hypothetical protein
MVQGPSPDSRQELGVGPIFFIRLRALEARKPRDPECNAVASFPGDGVAEAFHQLVENLNFPCHACFSLGARL